MSRFRTPVPLDGAGVFCNTPFVGTVYCKKNIGRCWNEEKNHQQKGSKTLKSFLYAFLLFLLLLILFGILVRFTPLPERWPSIYILLSLCFSCLVLGLFTGGFTRKCRILYGGLLSILFLFVIMIISILIAGLPLDRGLLQPQYLLCIACGSLDGIIGVNCL